MLSSNRTLSQRLDRTEAEACIRFAEARRRVYPASASAWIECGGAYAIFDNVDSPITQSFCLGLFEELTAATLERFESFFFDHGSAAMHEVSPLAGVAALDLLCARNYRPIELSSVLYRTVEDPPATAPASIAVRVSAPEEAALWSDITVRGWGHENAELQGFLREVGTISAAREGSVQFIAEYAGQPGAAGSLCIHDGVALFTGSTTVPELRRRGLQSALLEYRMRYAFQHGCDLAMMVAHPGSESQRNAERRGFHIAYTRTKWRLARPC